MKKLPFTITKKKALIGFIGLVIVILAVYKFTQLSTSAEIQTAKVQHGNLVQELTLSGSINASEHVSLSFQAGGLLTEVAVAKGDAVTKGQKIASLDQQSLRKTLTKNLNLYSKERNDFDETREEQKDKPINDELRRILEGVQYDLNNSVIDVEIQDLALRLGTLSTPIDGIVTNVTTPFAGVNITPLSAVFEVINPNTLYMTVSADQTEVVSLYQGQLATIILDSYPDKKYSGTVESISYTPSTNETGTVYEVKLQVPTLNTIDSFRIGMTGDVTFITAQKNNALYIPLEYVKSDDKGKYVTIDTRETKQYIETGLETDDNIEIAKGLKVGDIVYD